MHDKLPCKLRFMICQMQLSKEDNESKSFFQKNKQQDIILMLKVYYISSNLRSHLSSNKLIYSKLPIKGKSINVTILWNTNIIYNKNNLKVNIKEQLKFVHGDLCKIGKNLNFTVDAIDNIVPHFLDIEVYPNGLSIHCEGTNTG